MRADLQEMAEKLGILLSEKQLSQFEDYASLLLLRNGNESDCGYRI